MRTLFDKLPVPLADAVKATRRRYAADDFARAFSAGLDLARRAQGWHTARAHYDGIKRVTVRLIATPADFAEIDRLKSFFGRARWEITAAGVHFALHDDAGNPIAAVARAALGEGGSPGRETSGTPQRPGAIRAAARGGRLLALAPKQAAGASAGENAVALARSNGRLLTGKALSTRNVEVTVLFSDIRDFTMIAEAQGPEGTVSMLNDYLGRMVDCIAREGGMVDKFIGDAIMAGFGIPVPHPDDADRGVRSAVAMARALRAWNAERAKLGRRAIDIGIGLNTDTVVAGNIGSPSRKDFTMIGDGVNLASRLESACKHYGARILISDNTLGKLKGAYLTRPVDLVVVKGKTEPVGVHEVLDHHTPKTFPNLADNVARFKEGVGFYRAGEWDRAVTRFRAALEATPADPLPARYIARCRQLKAEPPRYWTGVWEMTSK